MAQKEIALQQVRTGKQRDLPVSLEKGQIGFSTDVGRVFIGLPSSVEPASLTAGRTWENAPNSGQENVEIITEFSPWKVVNDVVNKPYAVDVPANTTITAYSDGTSRLFLDYVAYNTTGTPQNLESGTAQLVSLNGIVILSQQNNTINLDGTYDIEFLDPIYDEPTARMAIKIKNSSDNIYRVEFVVRGWNESNL